MCECGLLAAQRALDGILPALLGLFYLGRFASRLKGALHLPLLLHLVDVLPEAYSETSKIGSTQAVVSVIFGRITLIPSRLA